MLMILLLKKFDFENNMLLKSRNELKSEIVKSNHNDILKLNDDELQNPKILNSNCQHSWPTCVMNSKEKEEIHQNIILTKNTSLKIENNFLTNVHSKKDVEHTFNQNTKSNSTSTNTSICDYKENN